MSIIRTCVDCAATSDGRYAAPYCCGSQRMMTSYACDVCGAVMERALVPLCASCAGASAVVAKSATARQRRTVSKTETVGQEEMW